MDNILRVGDEVCLVGNWNPQARQPSKVKILEINVVEKKGDKVEEADWNEVQEHGLVILENGYWAHGWQIERKEG